MPKPCKYGRNPVTGRCYTAREAQQASFDDRQRKRELAWAEQSRVRMRDIERRLAQAHERARIAGAAAGAIYRVAHRQREINSREAEILEREAREKTVRTAQGLLQKLAALTARTPGEAREKMQLERDYQKAEESLRQASAEAFYRKRPRASLNGLHCIFGR